MHDIVGVFRKNSVSVFVAIATGFSLIATRRGPGLSPDSLTYLAAAKNLALRGRVETWTMQPLTVFPPGLPLVGAMGEVIGLGAESMIRLFVAGCAGLVVLLTDRCLVRAGVRTSIVQIATAVVAVSPGLLKVASMVWSEVPFMVVVLAVSLVCQRVVMTAQLKHSDVVSLVLLLWSAFLLRYAAVPLFIAAFVIVAASNRPWSWRASLQLALFCFSAAALPMVWLARNAIVGGSVMGPRPRSIDHPIDVAERVAATFGKWVFPLEPLNAPSMLVLLVGSVVALIALIRVVLHVLGMARSAGGRERSSAAGSVWLALIVLYVVYVAAAQLWTALDPIGDRLLSPIFVPTLMVSSLAMELVIRRRRALPASERWGQVVRRVAVAYVVAVAVVGVHVLLAVVPERPADESALADLIVDRYSSDDRVPLVTLYSNQPSRLWYVAAIQPVRPIPLAIPYRSVPDIDAVPRFVAGVVCAGGRVLLAMFSGDFAGEIPLKELEHHLDLRRLESTPDGVLYDVSIRQGDVHDIPCGEDEITD